MAGTCKECTSYFFFSCDQSSWSLVRVYNVLYTVILTLLLARNIFQIWQTFALIYYINIENIEGFFILHHDQSACNFVIPFQYIKNIFNEILTFTWKWILKISSWVHRSSIWTRIIVLRPEINKVISYRQKRARA